MIHVGIDLHSRNTTLVAINDNGKILIEEKLTNTPANLDQFFGQFDQPLQAVVECTSNWSWVADWCNEKKIPLQLAHAKMLKAISYAKVKTDSVDARTLVDLLRAGLIPEAHKCRREQRDLRELTRGRLRMIERRSRLQSSLWQRAAKYNVIVQDVGWRYLENLGGFLQLQLPEVAWIEAQLLLDQIRLSQDQIIAYTHYPAVKEFYKKVTRRSGKHVARAVVGKELAKIVWHMLSKNEEYKGFKGRMTRVTTQNYWPQPIIPGA